MIILVSISADPVSGWGTLTHHHASALFERRIPFTLLLPRSARIPDAPFASCIRRVLPDLPLTFSGPLACFSAARLFSRIPHIPPPGSLVHSLIDFPYAVLAHRFARSHGLPFVMNAIGTYSVAPFRRFPDRRLFMPAYLGADRIVAISAYTRRHMLLAAGSERPIDVIYLPVGQPVPEGREDFSIFDRIPSGKRYILTVSSPRIGGRKGFDIVRAAYVRILADFPDAHLIAVGGVPATAPDCTVFSGVSPAELGALYSRCAVFAAAPRSSRGHFEGYGLVYREAGLYAKPVISTASGGVPEAIDDGVTGLLVPEDDVSAMARALHLIFSDAPFAARLGNAGRAQASAWTRIRYADAFLALYDAVSTGSCR